VHVHFRFGAIFRFIFKPVSGVLALHFFAAYI
jgi:hypothetical protein